MSRCATKDCEGPGLCELEHKKFYCIPCTQAIAKGAKNSVLKFHDHTLIIDEHGAIYVKEIGEDRLILSVDMYYCTDEGRGVADSTGQPEIKDKPAILLYDINCDEPKIIARYGKDGDVIIETRTED